MARALTLPAKLKEVSKSLKVNYRIFFTVVLFAFIVNLSILSGGLFLTEILIAGGIMTSLVIVSQMGTRPNRAK